LGDSTALFASIVGLGAILAASAFWFTVVKVVGGLYLVYLGVRLMCADDSSVIASTVEQSGPGWELFVNTYLVTALNPKGMVFFAAFLPQFISPGAEGTEQLWVLATTFVILATINTTLYAVFADSARRLLSTASAQRRFNVTGGSLLVAAGLWAILAKRPA
jgi:threonine/homoserine/homoserine lactone efflux protein